MEKETYDMAIANYEDLYKLPKIKEDTDRITESSSVYRNVASVEIKRALHMINHLYTNYEELGMEMLTPNMRKYMTDAVQTLKSAQEKTPQIMTCIRLGEMMLDELPVMKVRNVKP